MPFYVLPDPSKAASLLLQHLPLLYNFVIRMKAVGVTIDSESLTGELLAMLDAYFTTKRVTLPLVFAVVCWVKAVGCLQGDGGLGQTVSLTLTHAWSLRDRLERVLAKEPSTRPKLRSTRSSRRCARKSKRPRNGGTSCA